VLEKAGLRFVEMKMHEDSQDAFYILE